MSNGKSYQGVLFAVDDDPYCIWAIEPDRYNREFIHGYDPSYFATLGSIYNKSVTTDNHQQVSLALRLIYAQGLEALFSLLGAALQAPEFVVGWLLSYEVRNLKTLIQKIHSGERIRSRFSVPLSSWLDVSRLIHHDLGESDEAERTKNRFGSLWAGLANDLLIIEKEYNSIKHGFRAVPSGVEFSIRIGDFSESPEADEQQPGWRTIGSSAYGSYFLYTERIENAPRYQRQLKEQRHNWHPKDMIHGLNMISMSLNNILSFLKLENRITGERSYHVPKNEDAFTAPWRERPRLGVISMDVNRGTLAGADLPPFSRTEILSVYPTYEEE